MKPFQTPMTILALLLAGQLYAGQIIGWGNDISGEATGIPHAGFSAGAVTAGDRVMSNIVAVAAGKFHSLALQSDETIMGWGENANGEATGMKTAYPYKTNGIVRINGQVLSNIVAIAAGETHSLALKDDGVVVAWGDNRFGRSTIPVGLSNVTAIAAGWFGSLALRNDGTIIGWGQANVPVGLSNVISIAATCASYGNNLALKKDGSVFGWGENGNGQSTGVPTQESPYSTSGLVTINGQVLSHVAAIAAGNEYSLALKRDGTVVTWGHPPRNVSEWSVPFGLSNVVVIAVGGNYCLAITTNSAVADKFRP
jgi:alpha-tubulin suppressor-like RCC1 family protein